jgi:ADP-ribose pyrophosphatase YjhB (NUDIX family)
LTINEPEYPRGPFTIGVSGVVINEGKVLLVKLTYGHRGWILPGGYVRTRETIGEAVRREVSEETGLTVEPTRLISVRSRIRDNRNDIYVTFLAEVVGGQLKPDGKEIAEARYFTLTEMEAREDVPKLNSAISEHALKEDKPHFTLSDYKPTPDEKYELWL